MWRGKCFVLTVVAIIASKKTIHSSVVREFALNECAYANNLLFNIYRGKPSVTNVLLLKQQFTVRNLMS